MKKLIEELLLGAMNIPKPKTIGRTIVHGDSKHKHKFSVLASDELKKRGLPTFENIDGWVAHYYDYYECSMCGEVRCNDTVALI